MKLKYLLVALVLLCSTAVARADIAPEKRVEIERMLQLTGMEKLLDQMMGQMIASMRTSMPEVPPEFWARFAKNANAKELVEMIMPLYDKYYSVEDLRAVNAFYGSPAGQRLLSTLPQIMQESMALGQEWGTKMAQRMEAEARAEIEAKKSAPAPSKE